MKKTFLLLMIMITSFLSYSQDTLFMDCCSNYITVDSLNRYDRRVYEVTDSICNQTGEEKFDTTYTNYLWDVSSDTITLSFYLDAYAPGEILDIRSNEFTVFHSDYHPNNTIYRYNSSSTTYLCLAENLSGEILLTFDTLQEYNFDYDNNRAIFWFKIVTNVDLVEYDFWHLTVGERDGLFCYFNHIWLPDSVNMTTVYYDCTPTEIPELIKPTLSPTNQSGLFSSNIPIKSAKVYYINGKEAIFRYTENTIDFSNNPKGIYIIEVNGYSYKLLNQ